MGRPPFPPIGCPIRHRLAALDVDGDREAQDHRDAQALYDLLEQQETPSSHDRDGLADAPADWRTRIAQLRSGQLSLDDTAGLLQAALDGQQARRDWIIRNWPHVIEYQEINRTLTTATWGPDPGLLADLAASAVSDALADAIERLDPWLRAALAIVADGNTTRLDDEAIQHLERHAAFRAEQGIAPSAPLDGSWWPPGIDLADGYGVEHTSVSVGDGVDL